MEYERQLDRARLAAASGLQKAYRGYRDRQRVRLILWRRYEKAAGVIQAAYRAWRDEKRVDERLLKELMTKGRKIFRASRRSTPLRQRQKLRHDTETQEPTSILFRRCLRGNATHPDKMAIWRAIIELRRGHPYWSTHVAFKAMIESRGNLDRSLTLMSDETYALKNEQDVPMQLQKLFVPSPASASAPAPAQAAAAGPETTTRITSPISSGGGVTSSASLALGTGLTGIRNIRTSKAVGGSALDYSSLLVRNYFSKYYAGNLNVPNPCRKPVGFEPHKMGPCSPRGDGSILQATDRTLRHGMRPEPLAATGTVPSLGQLPPSPIYYVNQAQAQAQAQTQGRGGQGHGLTINAAAASAGAEAGRGSTPRMPTPRERFAKNTTPSKDTELLAGLLHLQQQMDALSTR